MPKVWHVRHPDCPKDAVYGGRPGPLGNPFLIGRDGNRAEVIAKHRRWFLAQPNLVALVRSYRGRDWSCWCAPLNCHCDLYLLVANAGADDLAALMEQATSLV